MQSEVAYLYSKIHNDDAPFDLFLIFTTVLIPVLGLIHWDLEHRLLLPLVALFATSNLFDDPRVEHWSPSILLP